MVPQAKKNLHECSFHLINMERASHFEEFEISFAAFVNSARNVTYVLQKEFINHQILHQRFLDWYGDPSKYENGRWIGKEKESINTKIYEMSRDELCKFFNNLRSQIIKEGINGLACNTKIGKFNSDQNLIDRPKNSSIMISSNGIYYLIFSGTSKEDIIPAKTKNATIMTEVFFLNPPNNHLDKKLINKDIISLSKAYFQYLTNLTEEWTGKINTPTGTRLVN